ncbi:MAG: zinc-ribbon domain-containing protein [Adlercreutzia sp.]|nr:zinc-ribbon domain-containing protein [Adlercreutzia sp.]
MSDQKYCVKCGAPLQPGQKFCSTCGAAVETPVVTSSADGPIDAAATAAFAPSSAPSVHPASLPQDPAAQLHTPTPPTVTAQMPPVAPSTAVASASTPTQTSSARQKSGTSGVVIAILAVLAVAGIALAVLFGTGVLKVGGNTETPAPEPQTETVQENTPDTQEEQKAESGDAEKGEAASTPNETTAPEEPSATEDPAKEEEDRAEKALYDKLVGYYETLGDYDKEISQAAESFNNNFKKESYSVRYDCSEKASRLLSRVQATEDELMRLSVPSSSANEKSYQDMLTCYYDCVNRISVISEAWEISLQYDFPEMWEEEILAPISRDNDGSSNRYYTEFKNTYPSAKPVKP